jgi:multisubunit Na+/H+ antiporter MnhC subunit
MKWFAVLLLSVGELLMTTTGGTGALIGLGVWAFGAMVVLDLLIGGGRQAQYLWAVGSAAAVWVSMSTDLPQAAIATAGQAVLGVVTSVLALALLVHAKLHRPAAPAPQPGAGLTSRPPAEPPDRPGW